MKPTITVITPAFNVEKYIIEALESIKNQTVAPDEVIIIDDGSTDGTSLSIRNYCDLPGWRVHRTRNNGSGPARNLGLALAQSEYVYFFDSDDVLKSNFIERIHRIIIEDNQPDVILFAGETFQDEGFNHPFSPVYQRAIQGKFARGDRLLTELTRLGDTSPSACLYVSKATLWSINRIAFPPILHEDEAVFFPLLALSEDSVVIAEAYFQRRIRAGSIMTSGVDVRNVSGILRVLSETIEFMARKPDLVEPDLDAWRQRISQFNTHYIHLCNKTGIKIAWGPVFSSILTVRKFEHLLRVIYIFFPKKVKKILQRLRKMN